MKIEPIDWKLISYAEAWQRQKEYFDKLVEYKKVSPDILVYNMKYDMAKNIYTDRDKEMAQIMADFGLNPSKKVWFYKLKECGFAVKRFLVNLLCCLVPVKRIRHKIRKKFNISTKFFDH